MINNNIKIISDIPINKHNELLNLIHRSFETYKNQGILFTCSNYTVEDLKDKILSNITTVRLNFTKSKVGVHFPDFD